MKPDTPCLMFALRRESMFFRRDCPPRFHLHSAPCATYVTAPPSPEVLVLETGVGRYAVERSLAWVLGEQVHPRFVLYAGFAGALTPALGVCDLLLADTIVDGAGHTWETTWPDPSAIGIRRGRLLTSERLLGSVDDKRQCGTRHHADAVDMEAAHVAAICTERRVPFGCLRAMSDAVDTPLSPALLSLLAGGRVSPWRAALEAARHPSVLAEYWRLERDTRHAARALAIALRTLLFSPQPENFATA